MTDLLFDLNPPQPPDPPTDPDSTGWPVRTGRPGYGPTMRDERLLAHPEREIGADQVNLSFWQSAGLGLVAPQAVFLFDPRNTMGNLPKLVHGLFTWHQIILQDVLASALPSWFVATVVGDGDLTFAFAAQVTGRDGQLHPLTVQGAIARPCYFTGFTPAQLRRCEVTITGNTIAVKARTPGGALLETPVIVVVY